VTNTVNVLGVGINPITMTTATQQIADWVRARDRHYVCLCNVSTIMQCRRAEAFRQVVNGAGMRAPDGMPLVWLARLSGQRRVTRVYGPDLMVAVMAQSAARGLRHYFYGGGPGIADRLEQVMTARFPGITVAGVLSPPFAPLNDLCTPAVAAAINERAPDIVWVGIGNPKQEWWMARMRPLLQAPVLIGVGAAFDFHTGVKAQAPRWMRHSGLEWLYRLVHEPLRLGPRYLVDNPWFVYEILLQKLRLKPFSLPSGARQEGAGGRSGPDGPIPI
jgi:N-acetylglucosaminyldiphosphoundecaprenol N-acetyl-beta-D-mannosaminyltransferase